MSVKRRKKFSLDELGFEPKTFRMQSEHSTPELHARREKNVTNFVLASKCALLINERYLNIPAEISLPAIQTLREEIPFQLDFWIVHTKLRLHKSDSHTIYYVNGPAELFQHHSPPSVDHYPPQADGNEWTHRRRILFVPTSKLDQICSDIEQKLKQ